MAYQRVGSQAFEQLLVQFNARTDRFWFILPKRQSKASFETRLKTLEVGNVAYDVRILLTIWRDYPVDVIECRVSALKESN